MKALSILIALVLSTNSYAVMCHSEDMPGKWLELKTTSTNNFVQGATGVRAHGNVFAGKITKGFLKDTYKLYDSNGVEFTFELNKELPFPHCRARVCPPDPSPIPTTQVGKLTSEEIEDEYFTCL